MEYIKNKSVARIACPMLLVVVGLHASGCTAIASEPVAPAIADVAARQFIIKFKPQTLPCTAIGIARLSSATEARLQYIRPLSDDACVIRLIRDKAADPAKSEQRIRQHPAIEWIEPDAVMKAF